MVRLKILQEKFKKEQLKCVKESYDKNSDSWNKKHFTFCKADLINAEIKGILEERKRILKIIKR